jgi:hypothetical protein
LKLRLVLRLPFGRARGRFARFRTATSYGVSGCGARGMRANERARRQVSSGSVRASMGALGGRRRVQCGEAKWEIQGSKALGAHAWRRLGVRRGAALQWRALRRSGRAGSSARASGAGRAAGGEGGGA